MGDEGIKIPALASFFQFKMLFGRTEENFNIPTPAVDTYYFFIRKIFVCTQ
jgi:hypothetical protein